MDKIKKAWKYTPIGLLASLGQDTGTWDDMSEKAKDYSMSDASDHLFGHTALFKNKKFWDVRNKRKKEYWEKKKKEKAKAKQRALLIKKRKQQWQQYYQRNNIQSGAGSLSDFWEDLKKTHKELRKQKKKRRW